MFSEKKILTMVAIWIVFALLYAINADGPYDVNLGGNFSRLLNFCSCLLTPVIALGFVFFIQEYSKTRRYRPRTRSPYPSSRNPQGGVYLLKSGPFYKIGKATVFDNRIKRIALQLPEAVTVVHKIYTNNPDQLERYWHKRFANKRKNGEWFALSEADVTEFKKQTRV
jgi:hypothetical protein